MGALRRREGGGVAVSGEKMIGRWREMGCSVRRGRYRRVEWCQGGV